MCYWRCDLEIQKKAIHNFTLSTFKTLLIQLSVFQIQTSEKSSDRCLLYEEHYIQLENKISKIIKFGERVQS